MILNIILNLIRLAHISICLLLAFGFLLPNKYLIFHIIFYPLVLLHWYTNKNNCFLTELENYIRIENDIGKGFKCFILRNTDFRDKCRLNNDFLNQMKKKDSLSYYSKNGEGWSFMKSAIYQYFGINITQKFLDFISYELFFTSWFISVIRYIISCRKKKNQNNKVKTK